MDNTALERRREMLKRVAGRLTRRVISALPCTLMWIPHNIFAHPVSEVMWLLGARDASGELHDVTIPPHVPGEGRG